MVFVLPHHAQMVIHLLAMRPGFHQPSGNGRPRTHIRPSPFQPLFRIDLDHIIGHGGVECVPFFKQRAPRDTVIPLRFKGAHAAFHDFRQSALQPSGKIGLIGMAFMRRPIPHMQMLKHIGQRPTFKLCRLGKSGVIQILHQLIQTIGLGFKIQGFA